MSEAEMRRGAMLTAAVGALVLAGSASAADVDVKLVRKGGEGGTMAFEPAYVKVAPGDTVRFLFVDSGYDAASIKDVLPHVAVPLAGENGKELAVRFEQEGVYGMRCLPHHGICMVVMVGALEMARAKKLSATHAHAIGVTAIR